VPVRPPLRLVDALVASVGDRRELGGDNREVVTGSIAEVEYRRLGGFTAVYWDQRGAGKSYDRTVSRPSMTLEQFISDLDELVDQVRERLEKPQVAIFGHSWGSVLGVLYTGRFPEKVDA
jgi:alpha-beta hydrolase superfamily lysophospholipase